MKESLKKSGKIGLMYLLVFIILIGSYMILLTLTSLMPSSIMEENIRKSSETLLEAGEQVEYDLKYKQEYIFTFTDALMLNTAYSIDSKNPINSFLLARKNYIPGQTKIVYHDSQYNLGANEKYKNAKTGDLYQTKELYGLMHGEKIEDAYEYARYWHGYLIILRPLLVLFDYSAIRIVFAIIALICIGSMLILLYKKINLVSSIAFVIGLISVCIWVVTQSINEFLIFLVAFVSSIILLLRYKKIRNIGIFFFVVGSISSFIDLLTTPIVTLGIVSIIYFLLLQKEDRLTMKEYIKRMLQIGISWCLGYGLTWVTKWLIVEIFFDNRPMLSQVFKQIAFRSEIPVRNGVAMINRWDVVNRNLQSLSNPVFYTVITFAIILMIGLMIVRYKKKIDFKENFKNCIPYIVIFFFPIIWMMFITQHSYTHAFFVYRTLTISIMSLLLVIYKIFEVEKEEQK